MNEKKPYFIFNYDFKDISYNYNFLTNDNKNKYYIQKYIYVPLRHKKTIKLEVIYSAIINETFIDGYLNSNISGSFDFLYNNKIVGNLFISASRRILALRLISKKDDKNIYGPSSGEKYFGVIYSGGGIFENHTGTYNVTFINDSGDAKIEIYLKKNN